MDNIIHSFWEYIMRVLVFIFVLLCTTTVLCQDILDGTVIVLENGNYLSIIQRQTGSDMTHTAIILYEDETPWVYESCNPDVHRYTLVQYQQQINQLSQTMPRLRIHYLQPSRAYTKAELVSMKRYANGSLGRPFGISSYITGKPQKTIHCSEYIGNILYCSGRYKTSGPKENPRTIYEGASKL